MKEYEDSFFACQKYASEGKSIDIWNKKSTILRNHFFNNGSFLKGYLDQMRRCPPAAIMTTSIATFLL